MKIEYRKGDATSPVSTANKIIVHICNNVGGWGRGFVMAISAKWTEPESQYRSWHRSNDNFILGEVQFVQVEKDIWIANIIGQHGIKANNKGKIPIRYEAVAKGLSKVASLALEIKATVHMPRIGCGLAGGSWEMMEPIILERLVKEGVSVTVYDL
jgi:O-acetyl-ADP-ribose deacetylase (regulator of RNase III)